MNVYVFEYGGGEKSENYARRALSDFTGRKPESFSFEKGRYGKPYVKTGGVFYSASHTKGLLICAVSENEVGADVEKLRGVKYGESIAERVFGKKVSEGEFFKYWVEAEAYLKYTGEGFSNGFEKTKKLFAGERDAFIETFSPKEGYAAAVCAKKKEKICIVNLSYNC